jgi:uncharacterized protein YbaP (TraB family)
MKNLLIASTSIIALTTFFSCQLFSKEKTPESSMLWKIERDDLKHPTYILGTMHLINKEYFYFPEKLKNLITSSQQLIMELEGLPDQAAAIELMRLPDSLSLSDYFTPEEMALVYQFAKEDMQMTKEMFDLTFGKMKPFIILQLITQKQFEGETESFEMTLMSLAKEHKIKTLGLETIQQQIGFFDIIPAKEFGNIIKSYFENADSLKEQTIIMQQIYRSGDLDSLARYMVESSPELMEFEDILLTDRNIAWVPQIVKFIFEKPSFIAVGAAHLAGENGLINLLRKEGFTVTPVAF